MIIRILFITFLLIPALVKSIPVLDLEYELCQEIIEPLEFLNIIKIPHYLMANSDSNIDGEFLICLDMSDD